MRDNNVSNFFRIFLGGVLGLCCAVFPVSVAAQSAAVNMSSAQIYNTQVRSNVSFGTGTVTANLPHVASDRFYLQAANDANYRGSVVRLNTRFNATPAGMVGGLRNMLRVNPASLAGVAVVTGLLAGIDWLIDEGQVKKRVLPDRFEMPGYEGADRYREPSLSGDYFHNENPFSVLPAGTVAVLFINRGSTFHITACRSTYNGGGLVGYGLPYPGYSRKQCLYAFGAPEPDPDYYNLEPATPDELLSLQFPQRFYDPDFWGLNFPLAGAVANYVPPIVPDTPVSPDPDKPNLPDPLPAPAKPVPAFEPVPEPPEVEQPIPEIEPAPAPAPDGAIQETTRETSCNWSGRELVCNQQITRQNYLDGAPLGEPQIENAQLPQSSEGLTDCALFPTLCEWLNWTKEPIDDDVDLSTLMHDFEPENDEFTLTLGAASCPAPIDVELSIIGRSVELSYEPICDLVEFIRPLILASAYLFAAYLYLGVLRG